MLKNKPAIGDKLALIDKECNKAVDIVTVDDIQETVIVVEGNIRWRIPLNGVGGAFELEEITPKRLREAEEQEMRNIVASLDPNDLNRSQLERIVAIIEENLNA
jgi:hypothetical protein